MATLFLTAPAPPAPAPAPLPSLRQQYPLLPDQRATRRTPLYLMQLGPVQLTNGNVRFRCGFFGFAGLFASVIFLSQPLVQRQQYPLLPDQRATRRTPLYLMQLGPVQLTNGNVRFRCGFFVTVIFLSQPLVQKTQESCLRATMA